MKKLSKIVSVVLSLVLCLGMASPAFAANFTDLQNAIDGVTAVEGSDEHANGTAFTKENDETKYYGYGWNEDENRWGVEAWDSTTTNTTINDEGNEVTSTVTTRNVQLKETVKHTDTQTGSIRVSNGQVVTIDLNGNNIDNDNVWSCAVVAGTGGNLTIKDTKENGNQGAVTGGNAKSGGGVLIERGGSFTLESGNITGNKAQWGGGVLVRVGSSFTMKGGSVTNNTATGHGGGINAQGEFTITGGTIENNTATNNGGGIYIAGSQAEISNVTIKGNKAGINGGGIEVVNTKTVKISDSVIEDNTADLGAGGILFYNDSNTSVNYSLENTTVRNNVAKLYTGGIGVSVKENDTVSLTNNLICGNKSEGAESGVGGIGSDHALDVTNNTICGNTVLDQPNQAVLNGIVTTDSQHRNADWDEGTITKEATFEEEGEITYTCKHCGETRTQSIPRIERPAEEEQPETPDDMGEFTPAAGTVTIGDQAVPLAGLMPLYMLLEELRQHEGIEDIELPEDFKWIDHAYAQAIYWGLQEELVVDTEEEPLDPDEALTVGLMREVLVNFVERYLGLDDFAVTLAGEDDEIVMDLGERLTVFYAELDAALKAQEPKAA